MATFILRNLDDSVARRLRARAGHNDRSVAEELRRIVAEAVSGSRSRTEFKKLAGQLRQLTAAQAQTPAESLMREGRDGR